MRWQLALGCDGDARQILCGDGAGVDGSRRVCDREGSEEAGRRSALRGQVGPHQAIGRGQKVCAEHGIDARLVVAGARCTDKASAERQKTCCLCHRQSQSVEPLGEPRDEHSNDAGLIVAGGMLQRQAIRRAAQDNTPLSALDTSTAHTAGTTVLTRN